jgi:geranylgeranyl diphosphate synthase type II
VSTLKEYLGEFATRFEPRLTAALARRDHDYTPDLLSALKWTAVAGGKRVRPAVLELWCRSAGRARPESVLDAGVAVELVHTSSLVLDDLPSMDNASLRRGRPTCHLEFGEATAILAAQAQLVLAFEVLGEIDAFHRELDAVPTLARAVGVAGMVGGQHVDLYLDDGGRDLKALEYIHRHKTGALFEAAARLGVRIGEGDEELEELASVYARNLGLAFQIKDDLLDVTATAEELGKDVGQDAEHATFVGRLGLAESEEIMHQLLNTAREAAGRVPVSAGLLTELCDYVGARTQ